MSKSSEDLRQEINQLKQDHRLVEYAADAFLAAVIRAEEAAARLTPDSTPEDELAVMALIEEMREARDLSVGLYLRRRFNDKEQPE
jgi:hypothetical protein